VLDPLAGSGGGDVDGSLPQHGRKSFLPLTVVAHRGGRTLRPKAFSSPAVSGPSPPAQRNSRPRIIGRYVTALTPLRRARTPCRLRYPGCPKVQVPLRGGSHYPTLAIVATGAAVRARSGSARCEHHGDGRESGSRTSSSLASKWKRRSAGR